MLTVRNALAALAVLLTGAAPAYAADTAARHDLAGKHRVYVCQRPTPASHVQHKDYGRLSFVTARELLNDPAPTAKPRCISAAELARYKALAAQRTQTIASR